MGSNFSKELPGQESKAEIMLNAKPSCLVLSQHPLCRPNRGPRSIPAPRPLVDENLGQGDLSAAAPDKWRYIKTLTFGSVGTQTEVAAHG